MFSANTSQVSNDVKYIEDFFSAWLRTGTGSSQTVTTGIKENTGALVISKSRSAATDWAWYDTFRGATKDLASNTTAAETTQSQGLTSFNTNGHTWGTLAKVNTNGATYVDFVLKPTPKFFDVVTYTGNGVSGRQIAHNLGSTPGCIIIKCTSTATVWPVYHRSLGGTNYLRLNTTDASVANSTFWNNTDPTSTVFTVGNAQGTNQNTSTYVAYLFAHDAGGFGLTGTDNVISCGSYTGNGSTTGPVINLGYEPQWVMIKRASVSAADWVVFDNMRGMPVGSADATLRPNTADAETAATDSINPTATGFYLSDSNSNVNAASSTYIYIAIRRGPMKTPTSGTSVFAPVAQTGDSNISVGFPTDFGLRYNRAGGATIAVDRLRGSVGLYTPLTDAESAASTVKFDQQNLMTYGLGAGASVATYQWRRAPGFFDVVCYTGTGANQVVTHNLGVTPELIFIKARTDTTAWNVYASAVGSGKRLFLNTTDAVNTLDGYAALSPTTFTTGVSAQVCGAGNNYVAYLFASCPGVSKVGSYSGTGATQTISCGFAARFVLIKRTDSTGDWYVWDTARGIVSANDPRLSLNSTAAEVTTDDSIDPDNSGFIVNQVSATNINVSSATYIYLAIA